MLKDYNTSKKGGVSPRIPNNPKYWVNKLSKKGKDVMIYTHDDLDGIFSGIAIKKYFLDHKFNIIGYGLVSYQDGWDVFRIDPSVINVAVDFNETHPDIDVYIDHHGEFSDGEQLTIRRAIKTQTGSAYEGIMDSLGMPVDHLVLSVIDMVDAAKYDYYGVNWIDLLNFDLSEILKKPNSKLLFAGAFNQLIKRGDFKTIIEVIHNVDEPSIYKIYNYMKRLYSGNNKFLPKGMTEDDYSVDEWKNMKGKDFVEDSTWRIEQMKTRSKGTEEHKDIIKTQREFKELYTENISFQRGKFAGQSSDVLKLNGYCIIGEMAYFGSGTWANPIRARSIIQRDIETGFLPKEASNTKWILLQYGDTLQICTYNNIDSYNVDDLPKTKEGKLIDDLKIYCSELLERFKNNLNFKNSNTAAGGHKGIGSISNIGIGRFTEQPDGMKFNFEGLKYIDIFKNYIISNLSKTNWSLNLSWENPFGRDEFDEPIPVDYRVMKINNIRLINNLGDIIYPVNYEPKPSLKKMREIEAYLKETGQDYDSLKQKERMKYYDGKHEYYKTHDEKDLTYDQWILKQKEVENNNI